MPGRVHVIGAGVAGLSAATTVVEAGLPVSVYEAAPQAGGRCRSYFDQALGTTIDNGTHLVLSGNTSIRRYLVRLNALDQLVGPSDALYRFCDLGTDQQWSVNLGKGRVPVALLSARNRPLDCSIFDLLIIFKLLNEKHDVEIERVLDANSPIFKRFLGPICLAVLNTPTDAAAASLMVPVVREIMLRGGQASRPMLAKAGLGPAFIDPALQYIGVSGLRTGMRLQNLERKPDGALLRFSDATVEVGPTDAVIVATPSWVTGALFPELSVPDCFEPIVNVHFIVGKDRLGAIGQNGLQGFVGGTAEWASVRGDVLSVTVSAARDLVEWSAEDIAAKLWEDMVGFTDLSETDPIPAYRVIKERRATFSQTPAQCRKRPVMDAVEGVLLAGDWTDTGLPATIEGAIRSGQTAADEAIRRVRTVG